jgi:hypothetical protein
MITTSSRPRGRSERKFVGGNVDSGLFEAFTKLAKDEFRGNRSAALELALNQLLQKRAKQRKHLSGGDNHP